MRGGSGWDRHDARCWWQHSPPWNVNSAVHSVQCAATLPILVMVRLACACTALIISLAPAMVMVNLMPVESCAEQQREQMMVAS